MDSVVVLRHQPLCVYVKLDDCDTKLLLPKPCNERAVSGVDRTCFACSFYPGVLAVKPCANKKPWSIEITMPNEAPNKSKGRHAKVIRAGLPVVCVKSSTLHVLQGSTADPGLVFH